VESKQIREELKSCKSYYAELYAEFYGEDSSLSDGEPGVFRREIETHLMTTLNAAWKLQGEVDYLKEKVVHPFSSHVLILTN
jgi:hypothetical protein